MNKTNQIVDLLTNKQNNSIQRRDNLVFVKNEQEFKDILDSTISLSNVYDPLLGNGCEQEKIKELTILNNSVDISKIEEYTKTLESKVDDLYNNVSNQLIQDYQKNENTSANNIIMKNEELLNSHLKEVEKICEQLIDEWKIEILGEVNFKFQQQLIEIDQKQEHKLKVKSLINEDSFLTKRQVKNKNKILTEFEKHRSQITQNYLNKRSDILKKEYDELLKDDKLFELSSGHNWNNFKKITLFISNEIGIINDLEDLLNHQELIRTRNYTKRAILNQHHINGHFKDEKKYLKSLYDLRVKFMYGLGSEIVILKFLIEHYKKLNSLRLRLETLNHPLSNYAVYFDILNRIEKQTQLLAKIETLKYDNYDFNADVILDDLESNITKINEIKHNSNVLNKTKVIKTIIEPKYELELISKDDKVDGVKVYVNDQEILSK
ncbi:MAG: hypothetical protein E7J51_02735 [Ureaplasma parvum]|uniref:hypothetical protein n=1 Tax=Ureaplasma parvum TaxID=134821 RepID=UPI002905FDE3|nr:hypothetical protein [Ureaplasma parvum]MDU7891974.1 hypothetical protein [Ureaplasma parvum]